MGPLPKHAPCVISVAEHTGWAHLVCVAASGNVPAVVARRRATVLDAALPKQPYEHNTRAMPADEADALIARVRRSAALRTLEALRRVIADLEPAYAVVAVAIRQTPFPKLPPSVTDAWASHRLLYSADGMIFQRAWCQAARQIGLEVHEYPRGQATPDEIAAVVTGNRPAGPPWTAEHRRAFAAGIEVLAGRRRAT